MKVLQNLLLITLVLGLTNCTNLSSLKDTIWVLPDGMTESWPEYSLSPWNNLLNLRTQYLAVEFNDNSYATYYVLNNNGSIILETHRIGYVYNKDVKSGYLILFNKNNKKLPFKIHNEQLHIFASEQADANNGTIFLIKRKSLI